MHVFYVMCNQVALIYCISYRMQAKDKTITCFTIFLFTFKVYASNKESCDIRNSHLSLEQRESKRVKGGNYLHFRFIFCRQSYIQE